MYCCGEGVGQQRRVARVAGRGDDVQDVGVLRRFDLDFAEQFTRGSPTAASCWRTPCATSGECATSTSVSASRCGSLLPAEEALQRRVRERAALEADAGGRFVHLARPRVLVAPPCRRTRSPRRRSAASAGAITPSASASASSRADARLARASSCGSPRARSAPHISRHNSCSGSHQSLIVARAHALEPARERPPRARPRRGHASSCTAAAHGRAACTRQIACRTQVPRSASARVSVREAGTPQLHPRQRHPRRETSPQSQGSPSGDGPATEGDDKQMNSPRRRPAGHASHRHGRCSQRAACLHRRRHRQQPLAGHSATGKTPATLNPAAASAAAADRALVAAAKRSQACNYANRAQPHPAPARCNAAVPSSAAGAWLSTERHLARLARDARQRTRRRCGVRRARPSCSSAATACMGRHRLHQTPTCSRARARRSHAVLRRAGHLDDAAARARRHRDLRVRTDVNGSAWSSGARSATPRPVPTPAGDAVRNAPTRPPPPETIDTQAAPAISRHRRKA